jgi:hypothetical protein
LAIELAEEQLARYLAKEGVDSVGAMAGPRTAANEFWEAGNALKPSQFSRTQRRVWAAAIKKRMTDLGIPKDNIGIHGVVDESGEAFAPDGLTRGGNVPGKGISVHGNVIENWAGFPEWDAANIDDRIDAIIAHEWMEFNGGLTHLETVEAAPWSGLAITKKARELLVVMRKNGVPGALEAEWRKPISQ